MTRHGRTKGQRPGADRGSGVPDLAEGDGRPWHGTDELANRRHGKEGAGAGEGEQEHGATSSAVAGEGKKKGSAAAWTLNDAAGYLLDWRSLNILDATQERRIERDR